jgi:hypothetical protein
MIFASYGSCYLTVTDIQNDNDDWRREHQRQNNNHQLVIIRPAGEEHTPVRGKQRCFTFFSFFSHSMAYLDVIALLPCAPEGKILSCYEREREQLHCRSYHYRSLSLDQPGTDSIWSYHTGKPNKSSHDTMITTIAHGRGRRSSREEDEEVCRPRRGASLHTIVN